MHSQKNTKNKDQPITRNQPVGLSHTAIETWMQRPFLKLWKQLRSFQSCVFKGCMLQVALQSMETRECHGILPHCTALFSWYIKCLEDPYNQNFHNIFTSPKVDIFLNFGNVHPLLTTPPPNRQAFYVQKNLALRPTNLHPPRWGLRLARRVLQALDRHRGRNQSRYGRSDPPPRRGPKKYQFFQCENFGAPDSIPPGK